MCRLLAVLLLGLVLGAPARAQYALRASVVASGASDATGGSYRLRATGGQPAVGPVAGGSYTASQGFWYPATAAGGGPLVALTLTPTNPAPPVTIPRGAILRYRADFAIAQNGPSQFQYWAEARLPNNQIRFLFGPVTVNGTPGTTVTRNLQQRVPQNVPPGNYVFRMKVGTYPGTVYDEDSFPVTIVVGEALAVQPTGRAAGGPAARQTRADARRGAADPGRSARAAEVSAGPTAWIGALEATMPEIARRLAAYPDAWLAWDEDGTVLEAGLVQDLTAAPDDETEGEVATAMEGQADPIRTTAPPLAAAVPAVPALAAPFPNPFASRATVRFALPEALPVRLGVFDVTSRLVAFLLDGEREAGWHEIVLDGGALAAGVYVVRLEAGGQVRTHRLTLIR